MKYSGYTLLEILIVMIILSLILAVGFDSFRDFGARQIVVNEHSRVLGDLRQAQSEASAGNKPSGCNGDLLGYDFRALSLGAPAQYRIDAVCASSFVTVKTVILSDKTRFSRFPTPNPVRFRALANGTNVTAATTEFNVMHVDLEAAGQTQSRREISISQSGEIK